MIVRRPEEHVRQGAGMKRRGPGWLGVSWGMNGRGWVMGKKRRDDGKEKVVGEWEGFETGQRGGCEDVFLEGKLDQRGGLVMKACFSLC